MPDVTSISDTLSSHPLQIACEIGTNYACAESERDMGSAVLNFDMDTAGRRAIDLILTYFQRNFNEKILGQNGPKVILRVVQIMCGTEHVSTGSLNECLRYIYQFALISHKLSFDSLLFSSVGVYTLNYSKLA
jgi:hypothetical protein